MIELAPRLCSGFAILLRRLHLIIYRLIFLDARTAPPPVLPDFAIERRGTMTLMPGDQTVQTNLIASADGNGAHLFRMLVGIQTRRARVVIDSRLFV